MRADDGERGAAVTCDGGLFHRQVAKIVCNKLILFNILIMRQSVSHFFIILAHFPAF